VAERPELIYKAVRETLLLEGADPAGLRLARGDEIVGRIHVRDGAPAAVQSGTRRWQLDRAGRMGRGLTALDENGRLAWRYRPRRLGAGGRLVPADGPGLRLRSPWWLRTRWTLRFQGGRVALFDPLSLDGQSALAIEIRQAIQGLADAALVVLVAAAIVVCELAERSPGAAMVARPPSPDRESA
jgi:hypothetical protein